MNVTNGIDESLRIRKFEVGDLVFAKLKGYPPWPAKINQIENIISGGKEKIRYNVYFYGTHQSSILRSTSLYHYDSYAKSIVEKWGRKPKFHEALKELEREMMDKISYLNQLRTTTPDSAWFNNACESLANTIDGAQQKAKSKNHCKLKKSTNGIGEVDDVEDRYTDESRKLGYEVMYMERIPYPDTPESLIVLSLNFNKDWVKEESEKIKEEERMKNCFVRIEPLPAQYAHLDPRQSRIQETNLKHRASAPKMKEEGLSLQRRAQDDKVTISDDSDDEAVKLCPVCRLCFFSQSDLKNHELAVHGGVLTAESMFDRLISGRK